MVVREPCARIERYVPPDVDFLALAGGIWRSRAVACFAKQCT